MQSQTETIKNMEKRDLLEKVRNTDCDIVEVICDIIGRNDGRKYEDESVLIYKSDEPSNKDLVEPSEHWFIFDSVADFEDEMRGEEEGFSSFIETNFKEVREFKTDF